MTLRVTLLRCRIPGLAGPADPAGCLRPAKMMLVLLVAAYCFVRPTVLLADDAVTKLIGTWKLVSWLTTFDGAETVEP